MALFYRFLPIFSLFLLFSSFTTALGVVPSSHDILYEPGKEVSYQLKVVNNGGQPRQVILYAEGELANVISFDTSVIDFQSGQEEQLVTVKLNQPNSMAVQGKREGRIVVRELPQGGGQISATLTVVSKLFLVVPYEGTYAETRLFVGEFQSGKQGNFVVEIHNLGTDDITAAQVFIKIYNPRTNQEMASLISNEERVEKKKKELITIPWTPNLPNGAYKVVATSVYDGNSVDDQKLFFLGKQSISIDSITVKDFKLGGIARFDILLRSEWSDEISDVHAQVAIIKGNTRYAASTTQTVALEALGSQAVNAYWDTDKVVPGSYDLEIQLFFNDQVTKKLFPIAVTNNEISVVGITGQVTGNNASASSSPLNTNTLLVLLVLVVLVVNVFLFRKLLKKKN